MPRETDLGVRIKSKKRMQYEKQAIKCDMYDIRAFEEIKNESADLKAQQKKFEPKLPTFHEFHQDVYDSMYKYSPQKEDPGNMKPGYEANRTIIEKMLGENLYKELRSFTSLDEFNSALATKVITEKLSHFLPDEKQMPKKKPKKGDKNQEKKIDPNKVKKACQDAMEQAKGECSDMESATSSWGTGPGMAQKLPYKEKVALAQRIKKSRILWQLAKIIGRFRALALSTQRTKISKGTEEVYSVETGDDLSRVLPTELAKLADPNMRVLFLKSIAEKSMLQFSLRDRKKETKGPIVCAIDNSGSMSGDREVWSKAIALGLLEICVLQRRKFVGIHFGSSSEISIHQLDWDKYSLNDVLAFAEHFFGGGTDFERPLDVCAHEVEMNPRADIVMITDGECDGRDDWLRDFNGWRDDNEVTVFSVIIDSYGRYAGMEEAVKKFSNGGVIYAKDVEDDNKQLDDAVQIFGAV